MHAYVSNQQDPADGAGPASPSRHEAGTKGWARGEVGRAAHAKQGDRFARDAAWSIRSHSE